MKGLFTKKLLPSHLVQVTCIQSRWGMCWLSGLKLICFSLAHREAMREIMAIGNALVNTSRNNNVGKNLLDWLSTICNHPGMDLPEYLRTAFPSQAAAAAAFSVTQSAISHWVTGRRLPSPEKAREIVAKSRGKVSFARIYGNVDG
jgi:hypothetical protein